MSFNDWFSSSSTFRQPLSIQNNVQDTKQQQYHHHHHHHHYYHYYYAPMATAFGHPFYPPAQPSHLEKQPLVPSMSLIDHQVPLKHKENIHRNSTLKLRRCVALFLHLIDNSSIAEFLQHDEHFRHADKYLLAMVLIYFWRAKLREHHYSKDSFYLALWLAHDAVEEDLTAKYGLLPWALQTSDDQPSMDLKNDFQRFLSKKNDLWTRMGFRARVTKDQCDEMILVQPNHWIWQRERATDYQSRMAMFARRQKTGAATTTTLEHSCSLSMSPVDEINTSNNLPDGQSVPMNSPMEDVNY